MKKDSKHRKNSLRVASETIRALAASQLANGTAVGVTNIERGTARGG